MLKIINVFSKKDLNNTKWFFSEKTIQLLTGIYIVPQIFNSLGSADIGKLKLVEAIFAMLSPMFLLGLTAICIREIIYYPKRSNFILATTFYMQLASCLSP
ncbi:MAG: hypothetical protein HRT66_02335 [Flavobacteriaceae bacterium]|nr:hypothetical protein [Flavobacteriaceae bacterium]